MSIIDECLTSGEDRRFLLSEMECYTRREIRDVCFRLISDIRRRDASALVVTDNSVRATVIGLLSCEYARIPVTFVPRGMSLHSHTELERELADSPSVSGGVTYEYDGTILRPARIDQTWPSSLPGFSVNVFTSGTTGRPKAVRHTMNTLIGRIRLSAGRSAMASRWLMTYMPNGFAGLQVILTALCGNGSLIMTDEPTPSSLHHVAVQYEATHVSGTPTFWRTWLMVESQQEALALQQVTLGGEPVDQALLDVLTRRYANARISHVYATTETGWVFSVHDRLAGFPVEWLCKCHSGTSLRISEAGVLEVKRHSTHGGLSVGNGIHADWVSTRDNVQICGERVCFSGRTDELLNVGGVKVDPFMVERVVMKCRGVVAAVVYGVRNPITGMSLAADVVFDNSSSSVSQKADLAAFCRASLPHIMVPMEWNIVQALRIGPSGKKERMCRECST